VLRRLRAGRRPAAARGYARRPQTMRSVLAPMKLPTASPSAVESIQSVEMQIAAPPQLVAPPPPVAPQFSARRPATLQQTPAAPATRSLAHAAPPAAPAKATPVATAAPAVAAAPLILAPRVAALGSLAAAATLTSPAPFNASSAASSATARPAQRLTGLPVPRSWQAVSSTLGGEFKFSVRTAEGRAAGAAVWSRVTAPAASGNDRRNKTLGGVSHAALRRTVIDRMIAEGGWVVNDVEREVGGRRVFVVFAQSEGERGARRNWTYYFTEDDGLVYSLSTTAASEFADVVAADAEQTLAAIVARPGAAAVRKN
jgi:hypothetical protein